MQESGKPCGDFNPDAFLHIQGPTFLSEYEHFLNDAEKIKNDCKVAQLYLVLSIAGLSSEPPDLDQVARCERQWTRALDHLMMENTMETLKCLILAVLYCALKADYRRLQHFNFTAATLGLPKILKDELVQTEYPSDADDGGITDMDSHDASPGKHTQVSSALALFGASRILSRVLEKIYPVSTSYDLSLEQMASLEAELDGWREALPQHLRLSFAQGKPSTDATCSRTPILDLVYHYIRTLIYRPAVGSSLGPRAGPALVSISESSKRIIQIAQLLQERSMSLSFCINRGDLLAICGLSLLYQVADLWRDSTLAHESAALVNDVLTAMRRDQSPGYEDLKRVSNVLVNLEPSVAMADVDTETDFHSNKRMSGSRAIPAIWEALLGAMDSGSNNVHNAIYGGSSMLGSSKSAPGSATGDGSWPSNVWGLNYSSVGEIVSNPGPSQSVLSMSEESISSGEEVSPPELGVNLNNMDYQEQMHGFNLDDLFLL
ncbi:Transcriptional activator protein acu-15 [Escovopsis weberi]|uniref:Transcriptional activator protein acu-15 n=1 Tax=Escovopsis weberi TaxID=150374 RepID=A0A0M9VW57_ESCWE|nr:Transcriptional activator protein acu-15 [Escovopsis weberi]